MGLGPMVHRTEAVPEQEGTIWEVFCFDCFWREGIFVGDCPSAMEAAARVYNAEIGHRAQTLNLRLINSDIDF
jgi:hypothetical protein